MLGYLQISVVQPTEIAIAVHIWQAAVLCL